MEQYAGTCRFILSCNYSSKIIEPIQSRCAVFRFRPLAEDQILEMVQEVAESEGLVLRTMVPQLWYMLLWVIFEGL